VVYILASFSCAGTDPCFNCSRSTRPVLSTSKPLNAPMIRYSTQDNPPDLGSMARPDLCRLTRAIGLCCCLSAMTSPVRSGSLALLWHVQYPATGAREDVGETSGSISRHSSTFKITIPWPAKCLFPRSSPHTPGRHICLFVYSCSCRTMRLQAYCFHSH
jgi:hypothetical protein